VSRSVRATGRAIEQHRRFSAKPPNHGLIGSGGRWRWQSQAMAMAGTAFFGLAQVLCETKKDDDDDDDEDGLKPEERKEAPAPGGGQCHLPTYTKAEVSKHTTEETRVWVTYKDGVYDITEFVAGHPGGAGKIMLAAGKAIDPYWNIFQQHFRNGYPLKMLEEMRIGTLAPGEYIAEDLADPYAADPERDPRLVYHNKTPCNAEVPQVQPALQCQNSYDSYYFNSFLF